MRILKWGSLNIDRVYSVDHFAAASETVSALRLETFCGGKGLNQSVALARAGTEVYHAGSVGPDGGSLRSLLQEAGVDIRYLKTVEEPSGHAIIQNADGQNCIIVYGGANLQLDERDADAALEAFGSGDMLLVQNETSCVPYIMRAAKKRGMQIAFNPSPFPVNIAQYPLNVIDIFLLNEIEGRALAAANCVTNEEILSELHLRFPHAAIVLTIGEQGVLYQDDFQRLSKPAPCVKAVDTTAAGDTFTGYFLACLAKKLPVETALNYAVQASGLAVSQKGAAPSIPIWEQVSQQRIET
ncbi:MAG: ribokinase [Oscillospiraceae bacterium]|nr:ribokinase [Oscillospiraceae bacterium]